MSFLDGGRRGIRSNCARARPLPLSYRPGSLEAAAVPSKVDEKIVLLEALDRVLARVAGESPLRFYETEHRAHGVDLRTAARMDCIETARGKATAVLMQDGERIAADLVIVGIGIVPRPRR